MNGHPATSLTIGLLAFTAGGSAGAHHSYAQFDRCQSVSIEGEIERVSWANPHVVITLRADDSQTYRIEWFDLQGLARAGIATGTLQPGDRVVVTGSESRDTERKIVTLLTEVRRAGDGWSWSRPFPVNPPRPCAD
jgi:hypothetical protein